MRHPLHDYQAGAGYFVTFCTADRQPLLGDVKGNELRLSTAGQIVNQVWLELPNYYPRVILDALQIMPDHVHSIIILTDPRLIDPARIDPRLTDPYKLTSLSEVIRGWKSISARRINQLRSSAGQCVWQDGFHERVIRNEHELEKFRYYLLTNPLRG